MNRKIRYGVFETNSSSCHSFSYGKTFNNIYVSDVDNCVHTELGEFGWEIDVHRESATKLAYILLAAASFTGHSFWYFGDKDFNEMVESFKETEEYKRIEDAVKVYTNCAGIVIENGIEGYIDHQSLGHNSFDDWLNSTGAKNIEDFIFGNIVLRTDNDNY